MSRSLKIAGIALALCATALAAGCKRPASAERDQAALPSGARHETLAAAEPLTRASLYDLALPLTDENGQARELDAFRGHPVVISMFYSSCPYACPTLISQIQQLERSLSDQQRRDVRVLLVSFDPERDTPAKLKALSQERRIDESRWLLARASQDKLRELAAVLGIKYKRLDDGAFNHSSVITVLDRNGFVRARSDGLGRTLDESLRTTLAALAQG